MFRLLLVVAIALLAWLWLPVSFAESYFDLRRNFQTKLTKTGPSPQAYRKETPPSGVQEILYPSDGRLLKAWVVRPPTQGQKTPVLVYFHGGFSFGADDLADIAPFYRAGFLVLAPMLRGENGNPGHHEMFLGEVDDARAAIRWVATQPGIDRDHIYTFGHSAGGVVSALVSLFDDVPVRFTGSAGGLYGSDLFTQQPVPFNPSDATECRLRTLIGNVRDMKLRHFAYVGEKDTLQHAAEARRESGTDGKLTVQVLRGDHFTSLRESVLQYLNVVQADLAKK